MREFYQGGGVTRRMGRYGFEDEARPEHEHTPGNTISEHPLPHDVPLGRGCFPQCGKIFSIVEYYTTIQHPCQA
jgi:hypothetical protein